MIQAKKSYLAKDHNNPRCITNVQSSIIRKHRHDSALMTTAHIFVCATRDGKNYKEIAREDFNNNLELVSVWIDYMAAINWIRKDGTNNNNKWTATDNGKKWVEKIVQDTCCI
jgi:hypothetical protein